MRDTADLLFLWTLGMFRNSCSDPTKITRLICSFYKHLTVYKNFKTITQLFLGILAINYFGALWTCLGMSDHTKLKRHDQFVTSINPELFVRNQNTNQSLNSFFKKKPFVRIVQSDWTRAFWAIIQETGFC